VSNDDSTSSNRRRPLSVVRQLRPQALEPRDLRNAPALSGRERQVASAVIAAAAIAEIVDGTPGLEAVAGVLARPFVLAAPAQRAITWLTSPSAEER